MAAVAPLAVTPPLIVLELARQVAAELGIDPDEHQRLVAELWRRDRRARRWLLRRLQRWAA